MAGGIIGSIVGQLAGQLAGQVLNQALSSIMSQFGESNTRGAVANSVNEAIGNLVKDFINNSPLPQFIKDLANMAVDDAVGQSQQETSCACQEAVDGNQSIQDAIQQLIDGMREMLTDAIEANCGSGGSGEAEEAGGSEGSSDGMSWLVALAEALGNKAGEHLGNAAKLATEINNLDTSGGSEEDQAQAAQEMTKLQAKMSAEAQMGNMIMNAASTVVKTIGEALSAMARKQ